MTLPAIHGSGITLDGEPVFEQGYPTHDAIEQLRDELLYQRAVQSYLWALPALSIIAMKEASEEAFGRGYHMLPIWKKRLDARTLVTTPNSDVIYAMGYLNLKADGPTVIEAPPGLQGILDDFFQRPLHSEGEIDGRRWSGDVGLPGPDKGNGGTYLILPPDYTGEIPAGYFTFRSRTYGVFVFWRGFFTDPAKLDAPVKTMLATRIYPLGKRDDAKPMCCPDGSGLHLDMLPPRGDRAFDLLKRFVDAEYVDPADLDMRGMLAAIGIVKDQPFAPDAHAREILDRAARRAADMARYTAFEVTKTRPGGTYYGDRQWVNAFPTFPGTPDFASPTYTDVELRSGFFALAYSTSPGMAIDMPDAGAKYPSAFADADGDFLSGDRAYTLQLPAGIPAKIFWSVTVYDPETGSGLDNGQRFPSINSMDAPATNADGSVDLCFGPKSPGAGKNWLATVRGKGFFVCLRLYGPTKAFFDRTWKPGDLEKA